jgi:RHS repeat-associated protein
VVNRYRYDPYGNPLAGTTEAVSNPWQYAAGYRDAETGFTKFGTRYYDPSVGRWTQQDPSGQDANPYAYAGCNPVNSVDPSGLKTEPGECSPWLQKGSRTLGAGDAVRAGYYGLAKGDWSKASELFAPPATSYAFGFELGKVSKYAAQAAKMALSNGARAASQASGAITLLATAVDLGCSLDLGLS